MMTNNAASAAAKIAGRDGVRVYLLIVVILVLVLLLDVVLRDGLSVFGVPSSAGRWPSPVMQLIQPLSGR